MNIGKMRTKLKLVWYVRPGRKKFWKAAIHSVFPAYVLSFFAILLAYDKLYGGLIFVFLLMIIIPVIAAYSASGDFRSLLHRAEDRKKIFYDFENSSRYIGGEVRLGEMFLFPRKGEIPVPYRSIRRMDLEWVTKKGYGIAVTLIGGRKLVVSERGALPLTRGEGMERYRPFIREMQRHVPGIANELREDEEKYRYLNGYAEKSQTRISQPENEMLTYLRPPIILPEECLSFFILMFSLILGIVFYYWFIWTQKLPTYLDPVPRALATCLCIIIISTYGFRIYTDFISDKRVKIRDLELRMQSIRAEGLYEELITDFLISVPYLNDYLRFGKKYLFLCQAGKIFEYSRITKAQHAIVTESNGRRTRYKYLYRVTETGDWCEVDLKLRGQWYLSELNGYCLPADEKLRKKNPGIVVVPSVEERKSFSL